MNWRVANGNSLTFFVGYIDTKHKGLIVCRKSRQFSLTTVDVVQRERLRQTTAGNSEMLGVFTRSTRDYFCCWWTISSPGMVAQTRYDVIKPISLISHRNVGTINYLWTDTTLIGRGAGESTTQFSAVEDLSPQYNSPSRERHEKQQSGSMQALDGSRSGVKL